MKSLWRISFQLLLLAKLCFCGPGLAHADARPGSVEWSDGRKLAGAISLTPGKDLRLFTGTGQVSVQLDEVKAITFKPEKEEMWQGFYFPDAGQATQVKTGEVYPIRYLQTQLTLADGKVLEGHLFTTTLYVETDDATEKVVLMAKQTGENGQKLSDLVYPTSIHFDTDAASAGSSQIDLTKVNLPGSHPPVVVAKTDLALLPSEQAEGQQVWTVPVGDPTKILFAIQATNGIHVAFPCDHILTGTNEPLTPDSPEIKNAVFCQLKDHSMAKALDTSLKTMQDFYDTRTLLGCFWEDDDVYSLVMLKRTGPTNGFPADRIPWSLVILHWKYDTDAKKTTLLHRVSLAMGRAEGNSPLPTVLIEPELLQDITALPMSAPPGTNP
jgi:hypothetical protein